MPSSKLLALAALAVPLASASPLRPRLEGDFTFPPAWPTPTPSNTWIFPGFPSVTFSIPPGYPTGGSLDPDPVYPGGPIEADPGQPGGPLSPDPVYPDTPPAVDPIDGDDDDSIGSGASSFHAGRDLADYEHKDDDYPPPNFGFGPPSQPTILPPWPFQTGGPFVPGDPGEGGSVHPDTENDIAAARFALLPTQTSSLTLSLSNSGQAPTAVPLPFNPGGPMHAGKRDKKESSSGTAADPSACTFTMAAAPSGVARACAWNGIETIYPSTTTVMREISCHGCAHVHINSHIYACPNRIISTTTSVTTARTEYHTVCATAALGAEETQSVVFVGTSRV